MIQPQKKTLDIYVIQNVLLGNSLTFNIGDAVIIDPANPSSVIPGAGTTGILLGTIVAIKNGPAGGNVFLQEQSVTTSSTNRTVEKVSVDVLATDAPGVMLADLNAAAGTTPNSQFYGYFDLDGTDSGQLDESSYSASVEEQFLSYGVVAGSNNLQVAGVWTKIAQA